eukprot:GHVS01028378.1.p1 GENE.GHVS01028378.1~~GHVS01028378.1.p1  ORF type:complete len:212 (+),score=31.39 GHVS01028378.1:171-806(+)
MSLWSNHLWQARQGCPLVCDAFQHYASGAVLRLQQPTHGMWRLWHGGIRHLSSHDKQQDLSSLTHDKQQEVPCVHDKQQKACQEEKTSTSETENTRISVIYFHHIYNPKKKRSLKELAFRRDLSGLYLFGKPGRVLVEGSTHNVEDYVKAVKQLRWQHISVKQTIQHGRGRLFEGFVQIMTDKEFGNSMRQVGFGETFQRLFDTEGATQIG